MPFIHVIRQRTILGWRPSETLIGGGTGGFRSKRKNRLVYNWKNVWLCSDISLSLFMFRHGVQFHETRSCTEPHICNTYRLCRVRPANEPPLIDEGALTTTSLARSRVQFGVDKEREAPHNVLSHTCRLRIAASDC